MTYTDTNKPEVPMQNEKSNTQAEKKPKPPKKQKGARRNKNYLQFALTVQLGMALAVARATKVPFDTKAFCESTGFLMEDVEPAMEKMLVEMERIERERQSYEPSLEDKKFELTGWHLPPKELMPYFGSDLENSSLFEVFHTMKPVEQFSKITNGSSDDEIREHGILGFVENLFHDEFDEDVDLILMNAFFWLLYYNGDRWQPVRSYAIEMLKLFPYEIQKNFYQDTIFIKEFSTFTRKRLATRGICSVKARPTSEEVENGLFVIKATDAFYSLLKPSEKALLVPVEK